MIKLLQPNKFKEQKIYAKFGIQTAATTPKKDNKLEIASLMDRWRSLQRMGLKYWLIE